MLQEHLVAYRQCLPMLEQAQQSLGQTATLSPHGCVPDCYLKWVQQVLVPARAHLPGCHSAKFEEALLQRVHCVCQECIAACEAKSCLEGKGGEQGGVGGEVDIDVLGVHKSLSELITACEEAFPQYRVEW